MLQKTKAAPECAFAGRTGQRGSRGPARDRAGGLEGEEALIARLAAAVEGTASAAAGAASAREQGSPIGSGRP